MFDSILCDPPYGHRAFQREIGIINPEKEGRDERIKKREEKKKRIQERKDKKKELEKCDECDKIYDKENNNKNSEIKDNDKIDIDIDLSDPESEDLEEDKEDVDINNIPKQSYVPLKKANNKQIFLSLIHLADNCLRKGGLLVFLYPTTKETENE